MSFPPEELNAPGLPPAPDPALAPPPDPELGPSGPRLPKRLDQVVNYNVRLSPDKLEALGHRIREEVNAFEVNFLTRLELIRAWRRDFEVLPASESQPWDNAAQVRAPLTRIDCQQHWSKLNAQVLTPQPPFGAIARDEQALGVTRAIEDVLDATLEEADWKQIARKVHAEIVVTGNCLLRVQWVTETARAIRHPMELDDDLMEALLAAGASPSEALLESAVTDEEDEIQISLDFEDRVVKDGVEFTLIPHEDMLVLPAGARTMKDVWGIGERIRIRGLDLKEGARTGKYLKGAVKDLLNQGSDPSDQEDYEAETISSVRQDHQSASEENPLYRSYECVELCWQDDLNDDGRMEWYVVTVHLKSGMVLRCQYMPYEHGRPYYVPFKYIERTNQFWGMGVAELVATLQDAATHAINNHQNLTDMICGMAGNFFFDSRSGLDVSTFKYTPGRPCLVRNVDGIRPMIENAASIPPALRGLQESLSIFRDWSDLLTATSNPALGKTAEGDKTLGEVRLVLGSAMQVFADYATGVLLSWADVADQVRWLRGQYNDRGLVKYRRTAAPGKLVQGDADGALAGGMPGMPGMPPGGMPGPGGIPGIPPSIPGLTAPAPMGVPGGEVFGIGADGTVGPQPFQGPVGFGQVPADVMLANVDLVPTGLGQVADQQTRFQLAMLVLQTLEKFPLTAQDPDILADALDAFLQAANFPGRAQIMQKVRQGVEQAKAQQALLGPLAVAAAAASGQEKARQQGIEDEDRARGNAERDAEAVRQQQQHEMGIAQANQQLAANAGAQVAEMRNVA